ncbi:MAG: carboxylating nicotinate-nucleotide diphosphorylase [Candidatus Latescibacteria bacterium]|nr:carboxylating nicotinate-nucleotide diphosphorylase [Candidatus Latescibacterota bacterium]
MSVQPVPAPDRDLVDQALAEDLGRSNLDPNGDLTAHWLVPDRLQAQARIIARQPGVVAGLEVARTVFQRLDPQISFNARKADGEALQTDDELVRLQGPARTLLVGERTALNFLQRLSGVATLTRAYARALEGTQTRITDTRKTTPGFRHLEKYAVRLGGGVNHRMGLYDAVLIKENHAAAVGGVAAAVRRARIAAQGQDRSAVPIYVEVRDLDEVTAVLSAAPDRIMLDNMALEQMRRAVALIRHADPGIEIEATGGITLDTVRAAAETGVDLISIGALTHSAPALDLSMLFDTE